MILGNGNAHLEDAPHVTAETSRHIACDLLDGHHVEHWADGGETALGNLVQLCRRHHRLVHEGGFVCEKDETGEICFRDGRNDTLPDYILPTPVADDAEIEDWMVSRMNGLDIDADTCVPRWEAGNRIDWNMAVGALFPN